MMKETTDNRFTVLFLFVLFILVGVLLYANTLDNGFHLDDGEYVLQNEQIHHLSQIIDLWTTLPSSVTTAGLKGHYRPMVFTTYMLNYSVGGLDPAGYHVVNILIHILVAFLVAVVMERLTGQLMVGALSGLLFLVHPFNAEAVNYVTARSSQLYTLFYLLAFYAYMRYRPPLPQIPLNPPLLKGEKGGFLRMGKKGYPYLWLGLSLLCFALAMLSKEMAVTLPVTLFLYEWLIGPAKGWRDRLRGLGLPVAVTLAVGVSYLIIRKALVGSALQAGMGYDLVRQLSTQGVVLVRTIGLILWPAGLTIDHRVEVYETFTYWPVAGAYLVLVGLLGLCLWWIRSNNITGRLKVFLLLWFFVALSPLMVLRLNMILQENRAYLAVAGVAGLAGMGLVWLLDRARSRGAVLLKGAWSGILFLVLMYAVLTIQRNRVWQDEISLWTDAVQKAPYSSLSLDNLGVAYERSGQIERANELYQKALVINPDNAIATLNMGDIANKKGHLKEAAEWYRRAIRLAPQFVQAYYNLGDVFEQQNRWDEAIGAYRQVIRLDPTSIMGRRRLAEALVHAGKPDEAVKEYETLMKMGINDSAIEAEVRTRLAQIREMGPDGR